MSIDRYDLPDADNIGIWLDITAVNRAEQKRLAIEAQLHHAQRLESLGTLAGGIAHDLNNTLVPILALAKTTMRRFDEGSRERAILALILQASERASDLVRQTFRCFNADLNWRVISFDRRIWRNRSRSPLARRPTLAPVSAPLRGIGRRRRSAAGSAARDASGAPQKSDSKTPKLTRHRSRAQSRMQRG
jgi:signal transduction histidine kinase